MRTVRGVGLVSPLTVATRPASIRGSTFLQVGVEKRLQTGPHDLDEFTVTKNEDTEAMRSLINMQDRSTCSGDLGNASQTITDRHPQKNANATSSLRLLISTLRQ
jgi:hypothetical protein